MNLYTSQGDVIPISGGGGGTAEYSITNNGTDVKLFKDVVNKNTISIPAYGVNDITYRKNIVHTATIADASSNNFVCGVKIRNNTDITSVELNWKVEVTEGTTTEVILQVGTTVAATHEYSSGEQEFTDAITVPANNTFSLFVKTVGASSRKFSITELPEGFEVLCVDKYQYCPTLIVNGLDFEKVKTYKKMYCKYTNKSYMAMGDSITQGVAPYYVSVCGQILGCNYIVNEGNGGTSMTDLATTLLGKKNYAGFDLITIAHGVNGAQPLGEIAPHGSEFDKDTFIGATQYVIETIQQNSPNTEIVIITPIASGNESKVCSENEGRRKALHDIADDYGLYCVSGTEIISDQNKFQWLSADLLHPSPAGQEHYGIELANILATLG